MMMSLLITIDSFFFLDSTSIGVYLSVRVFDGFGFPALSSIPLGSIPHDSAGVADTSLTHLALKTETETESEH